MDYLKTAIVLIREADEEKKRLNAMEIEKARCNDWRERYDVEARYTPIPRKSVINDNIKTARRLLLRADM